MAEYNLNLERARSRLLQAQAAVDAQAFTMVRTKKGGNSAVEAEKTLNRLADARDEAVALIREINLSGT